MSERPSLSRRAAEALRRVSGREPPPRKAAFPPRPEEGLVCLACGQVNPHTANFCNQCGQNLEVPVGGDMQGYLRAVDLLRSGELSETEMHDLLERLQRECAFYTAGTRYSVFHRQSARAARR